MKYTLVNRVLFAQKKKKKKVNWVLNITRQFLSKKKYISQDSIMQTKKKYMEIIAQSQKEWEICIIPLRAMQT